MNEYEIAGSALLAWRDADRALRVAIEARRKGPDNVMLDVAVVKARDAEAVALDALKQAARRLP